MSDPAVVVVSNRPPVSFVSGPDGEPVARRGAGGLVSGIGPVVAQAGATWVATALGEADRQVADRGVFEVEGFRVRLLDVDPTDLRVAYDVISNATLWFLHHGLWDLARRPRFDRHWWEAWAGYVRYNERFADAVAVDAPREAVVLVQDYHLSLVPGMLRRRRADLRTVHFSHTPFSSPEGLRVLPDRAADQLVEGLAGATACGFHTRRWAEAFTACCADRSTVAPPTFVSPLPADVDGLLEVAVSDECTTEVTALAEQVGERPLIVRVDRIELSKNLLRGFWAFDHLLESHPEWRERVVFGAFVYPSREGLPEYLAYRNEVEALARRVRDRWATPTWNPVLFDPSDRFARSVAALRRFDVLLVNPIRDGLNLVAKEGRVVNERDGVVVLSREAGVYDELVTAGAEATVLGVNPFDVVGTADALHQALTMGPGERHRRASRLEAVVRTRTAAAWLDEQLAAVPPGDEPESEPESEPEQGDEHLPR